MLKTDFTDVREEMGTQTVLGFRPQNSVGSGKEESDLLRCYHILMFPPKVALKCCIRGSVALFTISQDNGN